MKNLPYEHKGHSQHRESGIIQYLLAGITEPKRTFVEIGFGTGTENMTLDLLHQGYTGIGIDGRDWDPEVTQHWTDQLCKVQQMISPDNVLDYISHDRMAPDFFSLDIDSFDYEVAKTLLTAGFKPCVVCCEINQWFGPEWGSFPYIENAIKKTYDRKYAFGCGLNKYKQLWSSYGYEFFTMDTSATNAFWFDPQRVNIDLQVPRHMDLDHIDTDIIKQRLAQHWFWVDKMHMIYT